MHEPTDLDYAIAARVGMGFCPFGPLTQADQESVDAYDRWCADQEAEYERACGVGISTGGFDPYGTRCDLDRGHEPPHEGPDWFGCGRLRWTGGGMCAGDELPYSIVEHLRDVPSQG